MGTYEELPELATRFAGSLLVLTPGDPTSRLRTGSTRSGWSTRSAVSRTCRLSLSRAGRPVDRPRVVLERMTTMLRHGFTARELREASRIAAKQGGVVVEGVAMHLPLAKLSHLSQVERLMNDVVAAGVGELGGPGSRTVWVSHLTRAELDALSARYADFTFRPRIGTGLWLGDRGALSVRATVLDAHPVERGDTYGYRGRTAPRAGTILIVSGGTAHGIGLEAPTGEATLKARAASIARGGLDAAGLVRSPYSVGGKQRLFAEPPHMQASMLFIPAGSAVPTVGEEVDCRVRFTATSFDRIEIS